MEQAYFKTSHVKVNPQFERPADQSDTDFKTSHVKVNLQGQEPFLIISANFKTSHVKVNLGWVNADRLQMKFQNIPC